MLPLCYAAPHDSFTFTLSGCHGKRLEAPGIKPTLITHEATLLTAVKLVSCNSPIMPPFYTQRMIYELQG